MCEVHRYTTVNADGSRTKRYTHQYCSVGDRYNQPCDNTKTFKHPTNERRPGPATTSYYAMPPSPPSSDSSFPLSGNEADRSRRRRPSVHVSGGARVVDVSRKPSYREKSNKDHLIIVDPPVATGGTSHRVITPILKPSSPPTYYTTRPEVRIEVNDGRPSRSGHHRHPSHSSQDSGSVSDGEKRVRKLKRELSKAQEAVRQQKIQSEIDRANDAIANRPAVPSAPNPLGRPYRRPSVSVRRPDHDLADALHQLRVAENTIADAEREQWRMAKRAERRKADDAEAQKQRLKDRMTPSHRRATKIMMSDGTYRYEY